MILAEIAVEITGLPLAYLHPDYRVGIYMVRSATSSEPPHFPRHLVFFLNLICAPQISSSEEQRYTCWRQSELGKSGESRRFGA
jgi:hypothetical protein